MLIRLKDGMVNSASLPEYVQFKDISIQVGEIQCVSFSGRFDEIYSLLKVLAF